MKVQKRKVVGSPNRIGRTYAVGVALLLALAHKAGWIEMSTNKPISASIPRKLGRSYYRSGIDRKKRADEAKGVRLLSSCETLCRLVEEWYSSVIIELLAALVKNDGEKINESTLQNLEKERDEVRTNMRLRKQNSAHCLVFFCDKVDYCRDCVSGNVALSEDLEAAVSPVCRRFLHMAKEHENFAVHCLKGSMPPNAV